MSQYFLTVWDSVADDVHIRDMYRPISSRHSSLLFSLFFCNVTNRMGNMIQTASGFGVDSHCMLDFGRVEDGDGINMTISWITNQVEEMVMVYVKQKTSRK